MGHASKGGLDVRALRAGGKTGGGYVRAFDLPEWSPPGIAEDDVPRFLLEFADRMIEAPGVLPEQIAGDVDLRRTLDEKFDSGIPAGYTYFGQFIDHDVTFDPTPLSMQRGSGGGLRNFRSSWLDLDSVYGRGPADQPYLYQRDDPDLFLVGTVADTPLRDLPRNGEGRALIGDMRNDVNAIVSQLHLAFLLAHNALVARARALRDPDPFGSARRTLRWLYQYLVWNDFLALVTDAGMHARALRFLDGPAGRRVQAELGEMFAGQSGPPIPLEFAAAAYRFGHSMVRNAYRINGSTRGSGDGAFAPLFAAASPDELRGFRRPPSKNIVQWDWFLPMTTSDREGGFPQRARKIDPQLSNALAYLRLDGQGPAANLLAYRNLVRGWAYRLPAGTALAATPLARKLGITPIELKRGVDIDALWYYVLLEAKERADGERLGPLGSLIVCATFAALLQSDATSYVNAASPWTPDADPLLRDTGYNVDGEPGENGKPRWTLASLIRLAGLPTDLRSFEKQAFPAGPAPGPG